MTSILNLPATYFVTYLDWCHGWVFIVDGKLDGDQLVKNTKPQAEQAARQHYNNSLEK